MSKEKARKYLEIAAHLRLAEAAMREVDWWVWGVDFEKLAAHAEIKAARILESERGEDGEES